MKCDPSTCEVAVKTLVERTAKFKTEEYVPPVGQRCDVVVTCDFSKGLRFGGRVIVEAVNEFIELYKSFVDYALNSANPHYDPTYWVRSRVSQSLQSYLGHSERTPPSNASHSLAVGIVASTSW